MKIISKLKLAIKIAILLTLLICLYLFFFGRLHFINPWVIGFDKLETKRAIIYYHKETSNITCLSIIDSLVGKVEEFHDLRFKGKVEIVISADRNEHERYNGHVGTFVAWPLFGRVYLPYIEFYFIEKTNFLNTYLEHELSHSIINHNISMLNLINYPLWFMEGLAMYSSRGMGMEGYPAKDTVNKRISEGNFIHPNDWGKYGVQTFGPTVKKYPYNDAFWFAYSEFGYIVEDLIQKHGERQFIEFMHLTLQEKSFDDAFTAVYKIELEDYIDNYHKELTTTIK